MATLLALADAARRRRRIRLHYTGHDGEGGERELEPLGVVVHGGRWYAAARDAATEELRTFRVDRMRDAVLGGPAAPPPDGFDAVAHVARSLAGAPWAWRIEVVVDAPPADVAAVVPPTLAELAPRGTGTLLRMRADSLPWAAQVLAGIGRPFVVHEPAELREHVRALARTLADSAAATGP
jgi:predicted DNA-binding transcriptional regulator YafY